MSGVRKPCPICVKEQPKAKQKLFTKKGLKLHNIRMHGAEKSGRKTTIQVSEEFHKKLGDEKQLGEDFEETLKRLLGWKE